MSTQVLQGIRLIKLYAWEMFYGDKIGALREAEVRTIRTSACVASMPFLLFILLIVLTCVWGEQPRHRRPHIVCDSRADRSVRAVVRECGAIAIARSGLELNGRTDHVCAHGA